MPVDLFLDTSLPHRTRTPQFDDVKFSGVPDKPDTGSAIYTPLVGIVSSLSNLSLISTQRDDLNKGQTQA